MDIKNVVLKWVEVDGVHKANGTWERNGKTESGTMSVIMPLDGGCLILGPCGHPIAVRPTLEAAKEYAEMPVRKLNQMRGR